MSDRESGVGELFLGEQREKIGLVLVFVGSLDEGEAAAGERFAARIVAGGDGGEAVIPGPGAKHPELDLAVAHEVGIGRESAAVSVEQVGDHAFAVVLHEVDHAKLDAEPVAHGAGVVDVPLPRTMADDVVLVDPVLHVGADEVVTLLF